tara:strand:+ start:426 stop:569 length:144 start_codon:yes stop_codon:yes gene_type:complete
MLIFVFLISIATFILLYFVLKLIRKNNELIEKERPAMLKDVKKFLNK